MRWASFIGCFLECDEFTLRSGIITTRETSCFNNQHCRLFKKHISPVETSPSVTMLRYCSTTNAPVSRRCLSLSVLFEDFAHTMLNKVSCPWSNVSTALVVLSGLLAGVALTERFSRRLSVAYHFYGLIFSLIDFSFCTHLSSSSHYQPPFCYHTEAQAILTTL